MAAGHAPLTAHVQAATGASLWRLLSLAGPTAMTLMLQFATQFVSMVSVGHLGEQYIGAAGIGTPCQSELRFPLAGRRVRVLDGSPASTLCDQAT